MKARVKATGEIVEVSESHSYDGGSGYWDGNNFYYPEDLDFNLDPPHPEATISGWVARNASGKILFFKGKDAPRRPMFEKSPRQWHGSASPDNGIPIVPQTAFPSLTWQDNPIEVEITIKPKQQ